MSSKAQSQTPSRTSGSQVVELLHCLDANMASTPRSSCTYRDWFDTANLKEKQRVVSSSATNAGLWLTSLPSLPELSLADDYFLLAVKHCLGVISLFWREQVDNGLRGLTQGTE